MLRRSRFLARRTPPSAFTLIELLIVIAIIAVLVAVSMAVGHKVLGAGKSRTTEDTIRVLDASVVAYEQEAGEMPPSKFAYMPQPANPTVIYEYAIVDGRLNSETDLSKPAEQSVARYSAMCKLVSGANSVLSGINAKFVKNTSIAYPVTGGATPNPLATGIEVLDAWNRPIRMVHPAFDGGYGAYLAGTTLSPRPLLTVSERRGAVGSDRQVIYRRSYRPFDPAAEGGSPIGDADEGICPNRRPYFYSAGADGDPGRREDNVYSTRPAFTQETASYK